MTNRSLADLSDELISDYSNLLFGPLEDLNDFIHPLEMSQNQIIEKDSITENIFSFIEKCEDLQSYFELKPWLFETHNQVPAESNLKENASNPGWEELASSTRSKQAVQTNVKSKGSRGANWQALRPVNPEHMHQDRYGQVNEFKKAEDALSPENKFIGQLQQLENSTSSTKSSNLTSTKDETGQIPSSENIIRESASSDGSFFEQPPTFYPGSAPFSNDLKVQKDTSTSPLEWSNELVTTPMVPDEQLFQAPSDNTAASPKSNFIKFGGIQDFIKAFEEKEFGPQKSTDFDQKYIADTSDAGESLEKKAYSAEQRPTVSSQSTVANKKTDSLLGQQLLPDPEAVDPEDLFESFTQLINQEYKRHYGG